MRAGYFCMKINKAMTATWLREGRLSKGLTQKELSERSNISVRSIQRIENGDLAPRAHTLKTLASILGLSFEEFVKSAREQGTHFRDGVPMTSAQRMILSVGVCALILLLALAFISQLPRFPETTFEGFLFASGVLVAMTSVVFFIWRKRD